MSDMIITTITGIGTLANIAVAFYTAKAASAAKRAAEMNKTLMDNEIEEKSPKILVKEQPREVSMNDIVLENTSDKVVYDVMIKVWITQDTIEQYLSNSIQPKQDIKTITVMKSFDEIRIDIPNTGEYIDKITDNCDFHKKEAIFFINIEYSFSASGSRVVDGLTKVFVEVIEDRDGSYKSKIINHLLR